MGNRKALIVIRHAARERMMTIQWGEPITNVCAGESNPNRHAYFVKFNKDGVLGASYFTECTDKKGNFWDTTIEVIYPGHLDEKKCKELWDPIWEAQHGR